MDINSIKIQIIDAFSDHWALNDLAHQVEHFEEVFQTGMEINERLNLGNDPKLILFAAYFHDLFAWSRINHHELSFRWMATTDHHVVREHLNDWERLQVAHACHEHRASFIGEFTNEFSELINAADRGRPCGVESLLDRAIKFRQHWSSELDTDDVVGASIIHVKEKFGTGGYARYPRLYQRMYSEELEHQRKDVDNL